MMLPKTSPYVKKDMINKLNRCSFLIEDDELLEQYNTVKII